MVGVDCPGSYLRPVSMTMPCARDFDYQCYQSTLASLVVCHSNVSIFVLPTVTVRSEGLGSVVYDRSLQGS
jgi:hypothetical protein